jgi:integrase
MRVSEALALQMTDVTADGLLIRATKFQKNRLLPLHDTPTEANDGDPPGLRARELTEPLPPLPTAAELDFPLFWHGGS